ncbi:MULTISPECIES: sortase domain-bontaining protein [unclassified Lacticaseibacillus]|uniref:sortase domain-containing protein n=1 Tax=unclassified Lacticaseibacillus TaxID=2759744 RepID=UPI0019403E54|nr:MULTISPECIES: sortase [unclassified Lacticaseibacillus]
MKINMKFLSLGAAVVIAGGFGAVNIVTNASNGDVVDALELSTTGHGKSAAASASAHRAMPASSKQVSVAAAKDKKTAHQAAAKAASAKGASAKPATVKPATPSTTAAKPVAAAQSHPAAPVRHVAAPVQHTAAPTAAQSAAAKAASIRATTGETYVGTISGLGHSTVVVQGSRSRTKAPAQAGMAMTWGGATHMTTTDGLTSEIAGHAKSNTFSWIMGLGIGSRVSVTDANGQSRTYTVYMTDDVNDESYSVKNGADRLNAILSPNQGEAVVLQTCISQTVNRLVWAH